jgi:hypothetical protein
LGKEEETLGTALHTVKMVIHVKKTNGESNGGDNHTVHLARGPGIDGDRGDQNDLDDGKLGNSGRLESRLNGLDLSGRSGLDVHRLGVTRHFYFMLRK